MTDTGRGPLRFLVFSAALREQSLNSHLARLAAQTIEKHGGTVDLAAMAEFDAPSYDQDEQDGVGFPPGSEEFRRRLEASDAFVISSSNAVQPADSADTSAAWRFASTAGEQVAHRIAGLPTSLSTGRRPPRCKGQV